jgi:ribonuclease D
MRIIKSSIEREELLELPKALFTGKIEIIQSEEEAERAVCELSKQTVIGLDSETRPSFLKGKSHKVALLQLSSERRCYLFRINIIGLIQPLINLLENPNVIKVGLSLRDDFMMLHKRAAFTPAACIDLQDIVHPFGIQDKSLQKIYGILFGKKISKTQRLSNWENDTLTDSQQMYAATDSWACLEIYRLLKRLEREGDYTIV